MDDFVLPSEKDGQTIVKVYFFMISSAKKYSSIISKIRILFFRYQEGEEIICMR